MSIISEFGRLAKGINHLRIGKNTNKLDYYIDLYLINDLQYFFNQKREQQLPPSSVSL